MSTYTAIPYDDSKPSFQFETLDECVEIAEDRGIEEYEIAFHDGEDAALFHALGVTVENFQLWEDLLLDLEAWEYPLVYHLAENLGLSLKDLAEDLDWRDSITIYSGRLSDVAEELFDELYANQIPMHLHVYIDYEAFARDLDYDGYWEYEFHGETYVAGPWH